MDKLELRVLQPSEVRATGNNSIMGYAAVWNVDSEDLGGFIEQIRRGAFADDIRNNADIACLFNHDCNFVLGRVRNKTLKLVEDGYGLLFECALPDTTIARDLRISIARGDVNGCSFAFQCVEDQWSKDGTRREVLSLHCRDVGPVVTPAYPATSTWARSLDKSDEVERCGIYRFTHAGSLYVPYRSEILEDERRILRARLLHEQIKAVEDRLW
jgi:hypothetical protein